MRARDLETVSDVLFWSTLALVAATTAWTIWRTRGKLSLAVLLPLAWIALIPIPVILRPITKSEVFVDGFVGSARDSMYVAIAIANVAFAAYQVFLWSPWYRRLERFAVRVMAPAGIREHTSGDRLPPPRARRRPPRLDATNPGVRPSDGLHESTATELRPRAFAQAAPGPEHRPLHIPVGQAGCISNSLRRRDPDAVAEADRVHRRLRLLLRGFVAREVP